VSDYLLSLILWLGAFAAQTLVSGLSIEIMLRRDALPRIRRIAFAFAVGALLLALSHGYALELALRTGLFDLRQSSLNLLASLLQLLGGWELIRLSRRGV